MLEQVKITATTTAKVPNTSATAASSGSDLNGMAAKNAAGAIKARLIAFAAEKLRRRAATRSSSATASVFIGNAVGAVRRPDQAGLFRARLAVLDRLLQDAEDPLGSRKSGQGRPFYYFAYGAACSEVMVDITTGEMKVDARRHPPRRRTLAQSGDRHRPDRGRLRAGHGLAHHRGARVRHGRAAAHPRAVDLQDPVRLRRAGGFPRRAVGRRATARTRSIAPRRSASRR